VIVNLVGDLVWDAEYRVLTYPLDGDSDFAVVAPAKPIGVHQRDPLRFLVSDDEFWITGRGPAFTFKHNPAPELWDPGLLRNEWVLVNGGLFQISGVEVWRVMISENRPYGDRSLGLLMRDRTVLPEGYYDRPPTRILQADYGKGLIRLRG
jgi:hypothetical protein